MSCLFRALAKTVENYNEDSLRNLICNYLSRNPKIIDDVRFSQLEDNKEDYVDNMRNTRTWGGGYEIKAFCELFGSKVSVYYRNRIIDFVPTSRRRIIKHVKLDYNGSHYELRKH
jgi:hypothetical protein